MWDQGSNREVWGIQVEYLTSGVFTLLEVESKQLRDLYYHWNLRGLYSIGAPLAEGSERKDEEQNIRTLVSSNKNTRHVPQRPGTYRKLRRQRPRLSHKGPMPF
uniref:Apelin n=1 Tax=Pyxicephalus adspersus TaxID=30357 RepID=A0AAV3A7W9_PYXAD|nr:TPA: hypothetical protein GDO54_017161 [Pyxicephalus adspersus]